MRSPSPRGIYLLSPLSYDRIYGPEERSDIARLLNGPPPFVDALSWHEHPELFSRTEIILSGWGMAVMDDAFLSAFPNLKAVFYGAGSIKGFVTAASWERGITITSAYAANAVPVAEFAVAQIVLAAKQVWRLAGRTRSLRSFPPQPERESAGMYRSVIGLISLGEIGRMVAARLRAFDVKVIAHDPFVDPLKAAELGVELCSLEKVFSRADVVSCHAPWLKETEGMLTREHFAAMKPGATFINTARGAVVDEAGLIAVLTERPDLHAVLDVTRPEPPPADSPFYTLPNIVLTPHIAGSKGNECRRLGRTMVGELSRYLDGTPLEYRIHREQALLMA